MTDQRRITRSSEDCDDDGTLPLARKGRTYDGVLRKAHEEKLQSIATTLVQAPSEGNNMTAIFYAEVVTTRGVFGSHGEASPDSVDADFKKRFIAVAETRAKARALGDAINVGAISLEDLSKEVPNGNGNGHTPPQTNGSTVTAAAALPLTNRQRERLYKLLALRGHDEAAAEAWLCRTCNVDQIDKITKKQASDMIVHLISDASLTEHHPTEQNGDVLP